MSKSRQIFHPTLDVTYAVQAAEVERWRRAGWRLTKPRKTPRAFPSNSSTAPVKEPASTDQGDNS